jgi:transcriptional regulator with XRE-family HTH domain
VSRRPAQPCHLLIAKAVGARLRELRERRGLSQPTVASELGVTRQAVSVAELGIYMPSLAVIAGYARVLGVRVQTVLEPLDFEALMAAELEPIEEVNRGQ